MQKQERRERGPEILLSAGEREVLARAAMLEGRSATGFLRFHGVRVAMEVIARETANRPDVAA